MPRTFTEPLTQDGAGFFKLCVWRTRAHSASLLLWPARVRARPRPKAYRGPVNTASPPRPEERSSFFCGGGRWEPGVAGGSPGPLRGSGRVFSPGATRKGRAGGHQGHVAGVLCLATRAPWLLSRLGEKPAWKEDGSSVLGRWLWGVPPADGDAPGRLAWDTGPSPPSLAWTRRPLRLAQLRGTREPS